jgi:predicted alpha-1,6-mannanase (GH76 family)
MFNVDNPGARQLGALRICGKAGDRDDIACTSWARSTVGAERQIDAGALALMQLYDADLSRWGWWTGANCLQAMLDYFKITGSGQNYRYIIDEIYERNKNKEDGDYTNYYIDDTLWWGLAWLSAWEMTGDQKYLETAKHDCDYSYSFRDSECGGGVWWSAEKKYKAAIANELFIKLAASLYNRIGDQKYLDQAVEGWNWFKASGMINGDYLINDGLNDNCQNNGGNPWSYNQGVIVGGLVELHKATGDSTYLSEARKIVDAVLDCSALTPCPDKVLTENGCGNGDCGGDGPSFKGVFVRNLGELDRYLESLNQGRPYKSWLELQTQSIWEKNRNSLNQFGLRWQGPFDNRIHQGNQHSAFEAFVAAY